MTNLEALTARIVISDAVPDDCIVLVDGGETGRLEVIKIFGAEGKLVARGDVTWDGERLSIEWEDDDDG